MNYFPIIGTESTTNISVNYSLVFDEEGNLLIRVLDNDDYKYIPVNNNSMDESLVTSETDGLMDHNDKKYLDNLKNILNYDESSLSIQNKISDLIGSYLISKSDGITTKVIRSDSDENKYMISINTTEGITTEICDTKVSANTLVSGLKSFLNVNDTSSYHEMSINLSGGRNLLMNSSWFSGYSSWKTKGISKILNGNCKMDNSINPAILGESGTTYQLSQSIDNSISTYNISLMIKNSPVSDDLKWSGIKLYYEDNLVKTIGTDEDTNDKFVLIKDDLFINDTSGVIVVVVESQENTESLISSIMISSDTINWELNKNEKVTNLIKTDSSGISVSDNNSKSVNLSSSGISTNSLIIDDDLSSLSRLHIDDYLDMNKVKIVKVSGINAEGLAFIRK